MEFCARLLYKKMQKKTREILKEVEAVSENPVNVEGLRRLFELMARLQQRILPLPTREIWVSTKLVN